MLLFNNLYELDFDTQIVKIMTEVFILKKN